MTAEKMIKGRVARPRHETTAAAQLSALTARRDDLDRAQLERRRLEDEQLEAYANAVAEVQELDAALAERERVLREQVDEARATAAVLRARALDKQSRALAELTRLGRSAESLAALAMLPVKRVRRMVRRGKECLDSATAPKQSAEAAQDVLRVDRSSEL